MVHPKAGTGEDSVSESTIAILSGVGLFVGVLIFVEAGIRLGRYQARRAGGVEGGTSIVDTAMLGLLGLLIGFTYSASYGRLENRRALIAHETNAIGTAYLRLDVLPEEAQPHLRRLFRQYLEARLLPYDRIIADVPTYRAELGRLQGEIWSSAVVACRQQQQGMLTSIVVLPALNEMIDVTTTREMVAITRTPGVIILLIFVVALISSLLAGYAMSTRKQRSVLHTILFAVIIAISVYVILDLENPREGIIRLDATDTVLQGLLQKIN
jgi:hypothetical protein